MTDPTALCTDVAVVGAGPAGLSAAAKLASTYCRKVLVFERETTPGGIPRHCDHPGFGIRDLRTFLSGPDYANRLAERARSTGADIHTQAMVTAISPDSTLQVTTPGGLLRVKPKALIVATGARERPRPARLIPGDRTAGVYTTGHLQNLVHLHHKPVGRRAVIVGAELVSWSAVMTLREAGCATVLMTTRYPNAEAYSMFTIPGKAILKVPVATRTRVSRIIGKPTVQAVEIEDLDTGARRILDCDTVVLTGDWIPDHELLRSAGIDLDPHTRGPLVDTALRTSRPGVFAAGNLCHPVDTADIAALDGMFVADQVNTYLDGASMTPADSVRLSPGTHLRWLSPGLVRVGDPSPPRTRLLAWTDLAVRFPRITVSQNGHVVASKRVPWPAMPGRVFRIPATILDRIDFAGDEVTIDIANAGAPSRKHATPSYAEALTGPTAPTNT